MLQNWACSVLYFENLPKESNLSLMQVFVILLAVLEYK